MFINNILSINVYVYQSWENLGTMGVSSRTRVISAIYKKVVKKILPTADPSHSSLDALIFLFLNISYQFLPGACVKMGAISKSYYLKIGIHALNVIVLFGALSGPPSTHTNSKCFRTPLFKHAPLNSSRDTSARKSSICEAGEHLSCFPIRIAMYVALFFDTARPRGTLALSSAERKNTFPSKNKDAFQLSCVLYGSNNTVTINMLFSEVVLRSKNLNWNNLDMPLHIAMSCFLWKQPEKNELRQWMQRKNR